MHLLRKTFLFSVHGYGFILVDEPLLIGAAESEDTILFIPLNTPQNRRSHQPWQESKFSELWQSSSFTTRFADKSIKEVHQQWRTNTQNMSSVSRSAHQHTRLRVQEKDISLNLLHDTRLPLLPVRLSFSFSIDWPMMFYEIDVLYTNGVVLNLQIKEIQWLIGWTSLGRRLTVL